ncbi:MAG: hypothetical protein WBP41_01545, partial [Saprospiraceae bacterium]
AMTGCNIDQNGVISGCNATGTVTVKATNQNDPGCVAEKTLEINGGVKDVIVSDNSNEGRVAHKGQKLYLVGPVTGAFTGTANFTAVPNENSSFPSGQPTWSGPYMPPPGSEITWNTPPLNIGTYTETVGSTDPKSVTTEVIAANETSITVTVDTALIATLTRLLKGNAKVKEMDQFCSSPFKFAFPGAISVSYKESNVGKFKDPGYATKKDFQVEIPAIAGTGCMYFPCCTGGVGFGPVPVLYMTYVGLTAGISVSGLATKDPSAAANPQWTASSFSITGTGRLEAGVRLEADFNSIAGFIVGANLSTEVKIEGRYVFTPPKFEWNGTWGGLVGKVSGTIWYGSIDNNIEVAFQKNLLPGAETGWSTLYQFP